MAEEGEAELVEEFVELYGKYLPRIASRILGLLTLDGGELSSADLMQRLDISAASVSSMGRRLLDFGIVRRRIDPDTRRDLFSVVPDAWAKPWAESASLNLPIAAWATKALTRAGGQEGDHPSLVDLRNFSTFLAADGPAAYERYRAQHPLP